MAQRSASISASTESPGNALLQPRSTAGNSSRRVRRAPLKRRARMDVADDDAVVASPRPVFRPEPQPLPEAASKSPLQRLYGA